jgi:hypothetical protein
VPPMYQLWRAVPAVSQDDFLGIPLVQLSSRGLSLLGRAEREFDLVPARVVLMGLAPVLRAIMLAVRLRCAATRRWSVCARNALISRQHSAIPSCDNDRLRRPWRHHRWAQMPGLAEHRSIAERIRFDNFYIEYWTFWLDTVIHVRVLAGLPISIPRPHAQRYAGNVTIPTASSASRSFRPPPACRPAAQF